MHIKSLHQKIIIFLLGMILIKTALSKIIIPNLNGACYIKPGDINIGFLMAQSHRGEDKFCSEKLGSVSRPQFR